MRLLLLLIIELLLRLILLLECKENDGIFNTAVNNKQEIISKAAM